MLFLCWYTQNYFIFIIIIAIWYFILRACYYYNSTSKHASFHWHTLCMCAAAEKTCSVVAHTTVQFGLDNINCSVDSVCYNVVLPRLRQLLPQLPASVSVEPHRWQYSQVASVSEFIAVILA